MDTDSPPSSLKLRLQSRFTNANPLVYPSTSYQSAPVEPVFTQEHKSSFMQYTAQSAQIGSIITQIILTSPEPQTLLARVAKALGEFFQVDTCLIVALANPGDRLIANPVATTQTALWCADDCPTLPLGARSQLLEHPILKGDLGGSPTLAIRDLQASDTGSAIGGGSEVLSVGQASLPAIRAVLRIHTQFQSSVNGAIVLGRSQPHEWTPAEKELLAIASESVAVAISHVQLTRQVLGFSRFQTLLNQLNLAMRRSLDLDEILQMAIASTGQALQVSRGLILLLTYTEPPSNSQPSQHLPKTKVTVAAEWIEETVGQSASATGSVTLEDAHFAPPLPLRYRSLLNQSFWLSESCLCQQAFRDAPAPMLVSDGGVSGAIDLQTENLSIFGQEMMPALLIVPLLGAQSNGSSAANVLGFLVLQHRQPRLWHADELEFVEGVSAQISAATIQHQTLRQVQSLVEDRTAQLQHSLEVQAKLYEKTRQQIEQLQELNQLKEDFMSTMSHELRTPLTTMSLAIRMLRQPTLPPDRRDKYLKILDQECNKEIELINDLLSLQRLEADRASIQPQKIDLILLINELAQSFEQKWADKRLTLKVESPVRSRTPKENPKGSVGKAQSLAFNTDPDSLNRILLELLTNAGKYCDPDTTVCLQVTHQIQPSVNQVVLTLSNIGPGIAPEDLAHIFDKFRRGQGVTQQAVQGTGLGLALVKCLVEHLNGTIEVSSRPLENSKTSITSFTVTLPQLQQQF